LYTCFTHISKVYDTKFLGTYIGSTLNFKIHIEQITHKLSAACYAMRSVKPGMSQETMMMVYYAYFYSIMSCGLICWGNSARSAPCKKRDRETEREREFLHGAEVETHVVINLRI